MFQILENGIGFLQSPAPQDIPQAEYQKVKEAKIKQLKLASAFAVICLMEGMTKLVEGDEDAGLPAYPQLGGVFGDILTTPLSELFAGRTIKMFHRHDDYSRPQPLLKEPETCKCTISQLILRYCTTIENYTKEGDLTKHLQVLIHNERFRVRFAQDFHIHLGFLFQFGSEIHKNKFFFSNLIQMQYMLANSKLTANHIIASPLFVQGMQALEHFHNKIHEVEGQHQKERYTVTEKIQYILLELMHTPEMLLHFIDSPEFTKLLASILSRPQQVRMGFIPGMDFSEINDLLNDLIIHSRVDYNFKNNTLWRLFTLYKNFKHMNPEQIQKVLQVLMESFMGMILVSNEYSSSDDLPNFCSFFDIVETMFTQFYFLRSQVDFSG